MSKGSLDDLLWLESGKFLGSHKLEAGFFMLVLTSLLTTSLLTMSPCSILIKGQGVWQGDEELHRSVSFEDIQLCCRHGKISESCQDCGTASFILSSLQYSGLKFLLHSTGCQANCPKFWRPKSLRLICGHQVPSTVPQQESACHLESKSLEHSNTCYDNCYYSFDDCRGSVFQWHQVWRGIHLIWTRTRKGIKFFRSDLVTRKSIWQGKVLRVSVTSLLNGYPP